MSAFTGFIDIVGANIPRAPFVKGGIRAYYNTGQGFVPASPAQIAETKAAGMGVPLIDQESGSTSFAQGLSDILDVEYGAATTQDAVSGVKAREAHGWQSTLYVSYDALAGLKAALTAAGCNMALVMFGVADYAWSLAEAESLLNTNPDWAYIQYGDNITNVLTLIPGTDVTCGYAGCDIDVARAEWAAQFIALPPWPTPAGLTVREGTGGTRPLVLSWDAVPGCDTYMYEVESGGQLVIGATDTSETTVTVLLPLGTYRVRTVAHISATHNWSAWTAWSDEITLS